VYKYINAAENTTDIIVFMEVIMRKRIAVLFVCMSIFFTNTIIVSAVEDKTKQAQKVVLIDAGHGGIDGGAKSKNGTIEKDINLSISLKLKDYLEKKNYKVCMTRDDDSGLYEKGNSVRDKKVEDLTNRVKLKESTKCDIFVSIHQNMFPQSKYYGAQVWHASNEESKKLGDMIQSMLVETIDKDNKRIAKAAGDQYKILRDNLGIPSVIVECGFLSNANEEELLKTEDYQKKLAEAISYGIDKYFQSKNGVE
jgi:N-acetylmuramoyl-L-alanine amidase